MDEIRSNRRMSASGEGEMSSTSTSVVSPNQPLSTDTDDNAEGIIVGVKEEGDISNNSVLPAGKPSESKSNQGMKKSRGGKLPSSRGRSPPKRRGEGEVTGGGAHVEIMGRVASPSSTKRIISRHGGRGRSPMANFLDTSLTNSTAEVPYLLATRDRYQEIIPTDSSPSQLPLSGESSSSLPRVSSSASLERINSQPLNDSKGRSISQMRRSKSLHYTPGMARLAVQDPYQQITTNSPSQVPLSGEALSLPKVSSSSALASSNLKLPNYPTRRSLSPVRRIKPLQYAADAPHLTVRSKYQDTIINLPSQLPLPSETSKSSLSRVSSSPCMARSASPTNHSERRGTALMRSRSFRNVPHLAIQVRYQERPVRSLSPLPRSRDSPQSSPRRVPSPSIAKSRSPNRSKRNSKLQLRRSMSADTFIPQNLATRQIRLGTLDATTDRRASSAATRRTKPSLKRSKSADDVLLCKSTMKALSFDTTIAGNKPKIRRMRSKSPMQRRGSTSPVLSPTLLATLPGAPHRELSVPNINKEQTSQSTSPTIQLECENSSSSLGGSRYSVPIQSPLILATRPGALHRETSVQNLNNRQQQRQSSPAIISPRPRLLHESSSRSIGGSTHSRGLSRSPIRRMSPVPNSPGIIRKSLSVDHHYYGDDTAKSTGSSGGGGSLGHLDYDRRSPTSATSLPPLPRILARENSIRSVGSNRGLRRSPANRPNSIVVGSRRGIRSLSPKPGRSIYRDSSDRSAGNFASKGRDSFSSLGSLQSDISDSSHHVTSRSIHSLPMMPCILLENSDDSDSSDASFHCSSLPTLPMLRPSEPDKSDRNKESSHGKAQLFLTQQTKLEDSDVASHGRVPGSRRSPTRRRGLSRENSSRGTGSRRGLRSRSRSPGRKESPDGSKRSITASPKADSSNSLLGDPLGDSSKSSGHLVPPLQPVPASTSANTYGDERSSNLPDGDKTRRQSSLERTKKSALRKSASTPHVLKSEDTPQHVETSEDVPRASNGRASALRKSASTPHVLASESTPQRDAIQEESPRASNMKQSATLQDLESSVLQHLRSRSLSPARGALQSITNEKRSSTMAGMPRRIFGALESNSLMRARGRSLSPRPRKTLADLENKYASKKRGKLRTVASSVSGSATSATVSLREDSRMNGTASSTMNFPFLRTLSSERAPFSSNPAMSNSASSNPARSAPTPAPAPRPLPTHPERVHISSTDLVEARTVSDSDLYDPESISLASEYTREEREVIARKRQKLVYFGNTLCCIGVIIIGVAMLVLYAAGVFDGPTKSAKVNVSGITFPTLSPSLVPTPYELPLPEFSVQAIENNPLSAQTKAYEWLKEDGSRSLQRFALAAFYFGTNGEDWTVQENWLSHEHHECNWHSKAADIEVDHTGVCDDKGRYLSLLMTKNGLSGSLAPEVGLLTKLQVFDVASNKVGGTLPTVLGLMTSLTDLAVDINQLTGQVPSEIGLLQQVQSLLIHTNPLLGGTMPSELGMMSQLESLEWSYTGTFGQIPTQLGLLTKMTELYLAENKLEGSIPTQIFLMTSLWELLILDSNLLTGTLPAQVSQLSNLELLYINDNLLTGSFPTELGLLKNTTKLFLYQNQLNHSVPTQVGLLSRLERINFFQNSLTGVIPSQLAQCTELKSIDFEVNHLSSSVPWEIFQHLNLTKLYLNSNELSGRISSAIGHLDMLQQLRLDSNYFTGSIPPEFFNLFNLLELRLANNLISGTIPPQMGNLQSLVDLRLDNTNLHGNIPTEMGSVLENLESLYIQNTHLSGFLPAEACSIPELHLNCSDLLCGCYCVCLNTVGTLLEP